MTRFTKSIHLKPLCPALGMLLVTGVILSGCSQSPSSSASQTSPSDPTQASSTSNPSPQVSDSPAPPEESTAIVPGDHVGPVTAATTYDDLVAQYGEASLKNIQVNMGEGMMAPGTRVNQGDRSFSVVWTDESRNAVQSVRDFGSAWQVSPGISVGTSFADLQRVLGPFQLYGFAWDYGGTMVLDGTVLEPYKDALVLRLQPGVENPGAVEGYSSVMGERLYPSDTPAFQNLDLSVSQMIVMLK